MTMQSGSIRELWKVSLPLMISFLSTVAMMFIDRLFLSFYSPLALNAAASSGTLAWALIWGLCTLANMAEVFVAQYNGAKRYDKLGEPAWQMVWMGIFSIGFFAFMGSIGAQLIYGSADSVFELDYFRWMMYSSPFFVLSSALSAFYIGQGKTQIIKWLAVLSNLVNVILDPIFIFGIKGYFPALGIKGAAIATGIGMMVQMVVLFWLVLKKKNRKKFGSGRWRFNPSAFWRITKIGMPPALFVTFELMGWAIFYTLMRMMSTQHILVASVCQSILILFLFFGLGLEKGVAAVAGNMIGAKKSDEIKKLMRSGITLILLFAVFLAIFFIAYPDPMINWFFQTPESIEGAIGMQGLTAGEIQEAKNLVRIGLIIVFFHVCFENARWLLSGILTAAGDTLFLLIAGSFSVWVFLLAPTYFFIVKTNQPITVALIVWVVYSIIGTILYLLRFYSGKWKNKVVVEEEIVEEEFTPEEGQLLND